MSLKSWFSRLFFAATADARRMYIVAIAVLLALIYAYSALAEMREHNVVLSARLAQLMVSARPVGHEPASVAPDLRANLADDATTIVKDIHQMAEQRGLLVSEAKYAPVDMADETGLACMRIEATMRGTYMDLKKFLGDVMAAHEGLSLDALALRRVGTSDATVGAQLTFSLYYRKSA